jgi:cytochrome c oxidase subunit 1
LERATSSPPPKYNFLHLPIVNGRKTLWNAAPNQPVVVGLDKIFKAFKQH